MTQYKEPQFPAIFVDNSPDLRDFDRKLITVLGGLASNLKAILTRGVDLADNLDVRIVSGGYLGLPDTEFTVPHDLGKIPTGYIVAKQSIGGSFYTGGTADTPTTLHLKASAAPISYTLIIF